MRTGRLGLWVNGFQTHDSHQPLNPFAIDFIAPSAQMIPHGSAILSDRKISDQERVLKKIFKLQLKNGNFYI